MKLLSRIRPELPMDTDPSWDFKNYDDILEESILPFALTLILFSLLLLEASELLTFEKGKGLLRV